MNDLANNNCIACNNLTPRLSAEEADHLLTQTQGWEIINGHHLFKKWGFENFIKPLKIVNAIAELAEKEGHHPNINFGWGFLEITIWTHAINGLSKNDFILAAKIDEVLY